MPEHLFRFLLSELKTVRIRCKRQECSGAVLEVPVADMARSVHRRSCPVCGHVYMDDPTHDYLSNLGAILAGLANASGRLEVEFLVPVSPADEGKEK